MSGLLPSVSTLSPHLNPEDDPDEERRKKEKKVRAGKKMKLGTQEY